MLTFLRGIGVFVEEKWRFREIVRFENLDVILVKYSSLWRRDDVERRRLGFLGVGDVGEVIDVWGKLTEDGVFSIICFGVVFLIFMVRMFFFFFYIKGTFFCGEFIFCFGAERGSLENFVCICCFLGVFSLNNLYVKVGYLGVVCCDFFWDIEWGGIRFFRE